MSKKNPNELKEVKILFLYQFIINKYLKFDN
jgi:hypothetical protein